MIKHIGRDTYRPHAWTVAFFWNRRAVRRDGEGYWRGEFILTIEPPRRYTVFTVPNPYRLAATAWTGRRREIVWKPGYLSIKIRSPGGFSYEGRIGR